MKMHIEDDDVMLALKVRQVCVWRARRNSRSEACAEWPELAYRSNEAATYTRSRAKQLYTHRDGGTCSSTVGGRKEGKRKRREVGRRVATIDVVFIAVQLPAIVPQCRQTA